MYREMHTGTWEARAAPREGGVGATDRKEAVRWSCGSQITS
jgi:hypothetical protein